MFSAVIWCPGQPNSSAQTSSPSMPWNDGKSPTPLISIRFCPTPTLLLRHWQRTLHDNITFAVFRQQSTYRLKLRSQFRTLQLRNHGGIRHAAATGVERLRFTRLHRFYTHTSQTLDQIRSYWNLHERIGMQAQYRITRPETVASGLDCLP